MTAQPPQFRTDLYAFLSDLLPAFLPGATLAADSDEVLVPVGDGRARVATASLLRGCADLPAHEWPEVVQAWLIEVRRQVLESASEEPVEVGRLRLQAAPRSNELPDGLSAAFNSAFDLLVLEDREGASRRLQRADLDALGLTAEQAVSTALDQTISEVLVRLEVQSQPLPSGEQLRIASAIGVPYVSAGISSIAQLAGTDLPHGALVGVPTHSMIMIQPVASRRSLSTVGMLEGYVASTYDAGPDPCARNLYWFVDGDAHSLGTEPGTDGRPELSLSPALASVVDRLPG